MERKIDCIIIHCADTREDDPNTPKNEEMDIGVKEIEAWHKARAEAGEPWDVYVHREADKEILTYIGYNYVIRRRGQIEIGRPEAVKGCHCARRNSRSIGVCWVGRNRMTDPQRQSLVELCADICVRHALDPMADIYGHNQFSKKTCPNFNGPDTFESIEEFRRAVDAMVRLIK